MSGDIPRPIGQSKERVGIRLSVTIPQKQMNILEQLRIIKGLGKSEVVSLALDLALMLPPEEIAARVEKLRHRKASDRSE